MSRLFRRGGRDGGRRRPDDWPTPHARARTLSAERLAGPLDPAAADWLDDHVAGCAECLAVGDDYAAQRLELRVLRDHRPEPPRDLWARTAAAIEREAGGHARTSRTAPRRALLIPYALLSGALAVALVVGTLTSSRRPGGDATAAPGAALGSPAATTAPGSPGATPLFVGPGSVAWLSRENGAYQFNTTTVDHVCPSPGVACAATPPSETRQLGLVGDPSTVYGSPDGERIIALALGSAGSGASVYVVPVERTVTPGATPAPTASSAPSPPAGSPGPTPDPAATPPAETASPSEPAATEGTAPLTPSPLASGAIEIASGVEVVETTAAYSPDGSAFAFTAYPADGSHGPDIYVWRVGDEEARPVTSDHRSVFGSWSGTMIVGSSVEPAGDDAGEPTAFLLEPDAGELTTLPQAGRAWRPAVDPTGTSAVYWAGRLEATDDGLGWATREGRLVIGRWAGAAPAGGPEPTRLTDDQAAELDETRIARGPLADWDVRWDGTGTRLAVWIADRDDPSVGRLSLYVVDPFDGRIDLDDPPLRDEPALAGFSIGDGRLAWAAPPGESKARRVLILAWTEAGFGQVESAPGDVIVVR